MVSRVIHGAHQLSGVELGSKSYTHAEIGKDRDVVVATYINRVGGVRNTPDGSVQTWFTLFSYNLHLLQSHMHSSISRYTVVLNK